ncbi:hypothetical protein BDC45DRAFT_535895 [Circinella umbellata]|nr:hypothetical protein BDC45DRAFT_535895 [Circinella umbellata]
MPRETKKSIFISNYRYNELLIRAIMIGFRTPKLATFGCNGYICVTYHVIITRHFVSAYKNRFVAQLLRIQTLPNIQVITMSTDVKSNNSIIIEKCDKVNTPTGVNIAQFWTKRLEIISKIMKITVKKGTRINWKKLEARYNQQSKSSSSSSSAAQEEKESPTSTSTSTKSELSSTAVLLSSSDKEKIIDMYDALEEEKKWTLSSGTVVEDVMYEYAKECNFFHPVHFLMLDLTDECWLARFTPNELQEIKSYKPIKLEPLPSEVHEYLNSYKGLCDLESLTEKAMGQPSFHPKKQAEVYWAHKSVTEALDLFQYNWLPIEEKTTEADVVRRVFPFIEKCFDESIFRVISGEKASISPSERKNENRGIIGTKAIERKDAGHKVDMIISYLNFEYGCAEAGLKGGINSSKWINEANIRVPRLIRDMLWKMLKPSPTPSTMLLFLDSLSTVRLNLMIEMITIPKHYVCIMHKYGPMPFPDSIDAFYKQLTPLLTLTWQTKAIVKNSLKAIQSDQTVFIPTPDIPNPPSVIPPCPPSPLSKGKKRQFFDEDD